MQPWMGRGRKVSVKVISTEERSKVTQRPGQRVEGEAAAPKPETSRVSFPCVCIS